MGVQNSLTKTDGNKKMTLSSYLANDAVKSSILQTLGKDKVQSFITSAISLVNSNAALAECDQRSLVLAAIQAAQLELSVSTQLGQVYIVPFNDKNKGCKVAQFQLGYKGYITLAIRTGQYIDIDVKEVRQGEYIGLDSRTGKPRFEWIEDDDIRMELPIVGYMAYFEMLNGFIKTLYWSKTKMEKHADTYSNAFNLAIYKKLQAGEKVQDAWKYSSFWYKDFDGMAYKTMLRQLISKWGIMSIEMQTAVERDMGVIQENGSVEYVDAEPFAAEPEPVEPEAPKPTTKATTKTAAAEPKTEDLDQAAANFFAAGQAEAGETIEVDPSELKSV